MSRRSPDLRLLAKRQRWLIWLVLGAIFLQIAPAFSVRTFGTGGFVVLGILHILVYILLIVGVVLLLTARGNHPAVIVLCGILMLAPCVNLLVLVLVNSRVNLTFRNAGVKVGLMGVDKETLERALNPLLCKGCGYNLTGNVTGVCPECGLARALDPLLCKDCGYDLTGNVSGACPECGKSTLAIS